MAKRFFLRKSDVSKATRYIYHDNSLVARPSSWRNSGYGLTCHGGFMYRVYSDDEMRPYQLCASELMESWEVIKRFQLKEEAAGTFKTEREKKPKFSRPDGTRRSGRPSKQEVSSMFEGMHPIDDAAAQAGVSSHALRRAILAGKLPSMKKHGVYLVAMHDVKLWVDGPRGPRNKKIENQSVVYY